MARRVRHKVAAKHDLPPLDHIRSDIVRIVVIGVIVMALLIPAYLVIT